jgi:RNA recognition motif-containing protein
LNGDTAVNPVIGLTAFFIPAVIPEKAVLNMEARLYIGNLPKSTTQEELNVLFSQAGQVTAAEVVKDRKSGESRGFAFITMSVQSEADQAVSMFNMYSLSNHALKVSAAKPKEQHGAAAPIFD